MYRAADSEHKQPPKSAQKDEKNEKKEAQHAPTAACAPPAPQLQQPAQPAFQPDHTADFPVQTVQQPPQQQAAPQSMLSYYKARMGNN